MSNDLFEGSLDIEIAPLGAQTRAQRRMITEAFGDGHDVPQEVRFSCRIAQDVNEAIATGVEFENGKTYMPNPRARAQFGKNSRGLPYLTLGLIDEETGERWTLRWEGSSVPLKMVRTAVAHDEGRAVNATTVSLPFERADVHPAGAKDGYRRRTPRANHDTDKTGKRYPRPEKRVHSRVCRDDLENIESVRKAHTN